MIAKKERLADKPKDYMLRVRVDDELLTKLDIIVARNDSSRSHVVREGIERIYQELDKKETL
ncbi:putative transcriptional regulator [Enterococcus sp. PF1-24]|uniref:CopG family transcriptional regulator n=1 Tax=unclassified Enterococcus TaxID=2608891 RepID=UPI002477135F|nr:MULTISPECIES: CopG family transcriptional regulator [unclassified Enterococcus]MDH6363277.1 putative transcriptional regulator [Enterococcus sp. PFB1-1]MDH6400422.1 putative transcriptional regulator [Enterococcus sp. PF1-24]